MIILDSLLPEQLTRLKIIQRVRLEKKMTLGDNCREQGWLLKNSVFLKKSKIG